MLGTSEPAVARSTADAAFVRCRDVPRLDGTVMELVLYRHSNAVSSRFGRPKKTKRLRLLSWTAPIRRRSLDPFAAGADHVVVVRDDFRAAGRAASS
jgi:hypothetical protein